MTADAGDVDVLAGAGVYGSLGTLLHRCRQEWDANRGGVERILHARLSRLAALAEEEKAGKRKTGEDRKKAERAAIALREEIEREAQTGRRLILMRLRSLAMASHQLSIHGSKHARRARLAIPQDAISRCSDAAIDIWLDQRCPGCTGRKFTGGYGAPIVICRRCKGLGVRRRSFEARSPAEHSLAEWLLGQCEEQATKAARQMNQWLRR